MLRNDFLFIEIVIFFNPQSIIIIIISIFL